MDTNKIKIIVMDAKALVKGEQTAEPVMAAMIAEMGKSPNFAVAIIQHLRQQGCDLLSMKGETAELFKAKFRPQIERLGERELAQIKRISDKLFS